MIVVVVELQIKILMLTKKRSHESSIVIENCDLSTIETEWDSRVRQIVTTMENSILTAFIIPIMCEHSSLWFVCHISVRMNIIAVTYPYSKPRLL